MAIKTQTCIQKVQWIIDELILEGFSNVNPGILQTSIGDELSNQWEQDPLLGGRPLAQMMPHHIYLDTSPNTTTQNSGQKNRPHYQPINLWQSDTEIVSIIIIFKSKFQENYL